MQTVEDGLVGVGDLVGVIVGFLVGVRVGPPGVTVGLGVDEGRGVDEGWGVAVGALGLQANPTHSERDAGIKVPLSQQTQVWRSWQAHSLWGMPPAQL